MTAEIVIMNKHGVALAADSAVSIGNQKVYNSANKLFALSKAHPIGIMIYGNATFMGIPWETIIKKYRGDHLGSDCFDTLKEHAAHFFEYLSSSDLISTATEQHYLKNRFIIIAQKMVDLIKEALQERFELATSPVSAEDIRKMIPEWIAAMKEQAKKIEPIDGLTTKEKADIRRRYMPIFTELLDRCLEKLPVSSAERKKLIGIGYLFLFSKIDLGSNTGVVIAGYGADEIFPKTEDITLSGKIGSKLIIEKSSSQQIKISMGASVAPYAQREMVDTIMRGIDPNLETEIRSLVEKTIDKLPGILAEKYNLNPDDDTVESIQKDVAKVKNAMMNAIDVAQRDHYIRPVIDSVGILPLAELGAMAEALINITSFKRRVTMVSESVGGPIDVALISKGDGFVWIKRKHYFEPQLNHQYFINQSRTSS